MSLLRSPIAQASRSSAHLAAILLSAAEMVTISAAVSDTFAVGAVSADANTEVDIIVTIASAIFLMEAFCMI